MKNALTIFIILTIFSCGEKGPDPQTSEKSKVELFNHWESSKLLIRQEKHSSSDCELTLDEILLNWEKHSTPYEQPFYISGNQFEDQFCTWTRLTFVNPSPLIQTRILYFPKAWKYLQAFFPIKDSIYVKKEAGIHLPQEVLQVSIPPQDTLRIFVRYPAIRNAFQPTLNVWEMSEKEYLALQSRVKFKFLLVGIVIFPILFFFAQLLVQKDQLTFYYLIFLLGAALHLFTILDTNPYFLLLPRIITSGTLIMKMFLISSFLTLTGLIKYIHVFLEISSGAKFWFNAGNVLILFLFLFSFAPVFFNSLVAGPDGEGYISWYRMLLILVFVYIIVLSIWAVWQRIRYSWLLFGAFGPLLLAGLWYAAYFFIARGFSAQSIESLALILGFILTLVFFGIILGVRNNATRIAKQKLELQTEQLRKMDDFKSRFYTNITHEFRTPLTVIKGLSKQIEDKKIRTLVRRNSDRILHMVNQLLDLSKLETSSLTIQWVHGDIIPYLRYLTESVHSLASAKKLNLAFFADEVKLFMDYDERKIQYILSNLLSNAVKFTPEYGSIKVVARKTMEKGDPYMLMQVIDTGSGIPESQLDHIFDRFYQIDNSSTRKTEGSGIGLALVKELVELFAGWIRVESEPGKGSTFSVFLPVYQNRQARPTTKTHPVFPAKMVPEDPAGEKTKEPVGKEEKPLVLVIEDNADVQEYIISCLKNSYRIQTARHGKEGVEKALAQVPNVIISDVMMPEMDGFEVCAQLKSDQRTSHIPIILLTARATQEDKITGLTYGADAYLTKPFDKDELMIRLANLAAQSKRLQEWLSGTPDSLDSDHPVKAREAAFLNGLKVIIEGQMDNEDFNTQMLCREIGMSRTQLHRKLKALTGKATAAYLRSIRLNKAMELLKNTEMHVGEIASVVGFKDFSHFTRSYAREFGITPSETRK